MVMDQENDVNSYNFSSGSGQTIDLISLAKLIVKRKLVFISTIFLCVVIGIFYVYIRKPQYEYRQVIQPAGWSSTRNMVNYSDFQKADRIVQLIKTVYLPEIIKVFNNSFSTYIFPKTVNVEIGTSSTQQNSNTTKDEDKNENNFIILTAKGTKQDASKFQKLFDMILDNIKKNEVNIIAQNKNELHLQLLSQQSYMKYLKSDKKILSKKLAMIQSNTQGNNAVQNMIMQDSTVNRMQQDDHAYFTSRLKLGQLEAQLNSIESSKYLHPMVELRVVDDISLWMVVLFSLIFGIVLGLFMVFLFKFVDEVRGR